MTPVGCHCYMLVILLLVSSASSWLEEKMIRFGSRVYLERKEQPWFRYPHSDHERVPVAEKDTSSFGKHYIPSEDNFMEPSWTAEESLYLPCLSKACVCPYFTGNFTNGECILLDGTVLQKGLRQELRTLSDEKRQLWEATLNHMKSSGLYNRLARVHKYSGVHSGPAFTVWHREFLKRMELVIRRHLPDINMGVPYWDSSLDAYLPDPKDSIIFSSLFLGETDKDGFVITGPYANWTTMEGRPHIFREMITESGGELLNNARIDWLINNEDIAMVLGVTMPLTSCPMTHKLDARMLEYSHDYVHFYIAGDMGKSFSSSNDVIFIYHHSMIDNIFEMWRQNKQTRQERESIYPPNNEDCFPPWHNGDAIMPFLLPYTNKDALSNKYTDEMYEFASRPTCNRFSKDCGSKYLFCNILDYQQPFCMSKVKLGGNCTGYEGTEICYNANCINGECKTTTMEKNEKTKLFM